MTILETLDKKDLESLDGIILAKLGKKDAPLPINTGVELLRRVTEVKFQDVPLNL